MIEANDNGFLKPKLQLSNGYPANFTSLARILNVVCLDQRERIPQVDLAIKVGLTERHVKHLCGMAHAFGLLEQVTYKPTPLGRLVYTYDPFFDDIGTLWFLHYMFGSNAYYLVWHRMVTSILPTHKRVTREQARMDFGDLQNTLSKYSLQKHVLQEINTVLDAYTNQQFVRLAYLHLEEDVFYILTPGEPVPPLVLGACIARFLQYQHLKDTAVSVESLLRASNGPGIVLQLEEKRFRFLLEQLKMQPGFSLESRADLDQVRLSDTMLDYMWMERYYASR